MTAAPTIGDPAPEAALLDVEGRPILLSSFWREVPAVVVFLRYFGCPFCQAHVVHLRQDRQRFEDAGGWVVLVGQGSAEDGARFVGSREVPFPVLLDPGAEAYRSYGLGRGSVAQVFGPRVALPFLRNNVHVETRQRGLRGGDLMQMPGTFVVDSSGVIRLAHRNRTVADSPRNDHLLDVLLGLRAAGKAPAPPRGPSREAGVPGSPDS